MKRIAVIAVSVVLAIALFAWAGETTTPKRGERRMPEFRPM